MSLRSLAPEIQLFTVTLTAGQSAAIPADISVNSKILVTARTPAPGANVNTASYSARLVDRTNGGVSTGGQFIVSALTGANPPVVNTTDVSVVDIAVLDTTT